VAVVLGGCVAVAWLALVAAYGRDLDRKLWPGVGAVCLVYVSGGLIVSHIRGFTAAGTTAVLITVPLVALVVTGGHPARMIGAEWLSDGHAGARRSRNDEADKYGWRAVIVIIAVVIVFAIVDPGLLPQR
jgi:hypothetical protein